MTKGKKEFNKAKVNLRKRIKSAEAAGFEIKDEIKNLMNYNYEDFSAQKAVAIRKSFNSITTAYIRNSRNIKSYTTKEGIKLNPDEYRDLVVYSYKKKAKELYNLDISEIRDKYKKEAEKIGYKQFDLKNDKSISDTEYDIINERLKANRKDYYAISNFLKGAQHSLNTVVYSKNNIRFSRAIQFMSKMNYHEAADVISMIDDMKLNLLDQIYNSDFVDLDEDTGSVLEKDLSKLESILENYGYKTLSESQLNAYEQEINRNIGIINNKIEAYNKSVWLSMQK